jgi:hypothetical protein
MENKTIIDELYYCAAQCARCYSACQLEKDKEAFARCMMMDEDCEQICRLTGQVLERNSENAELFLKVCSEICGKCAVECEKHPKVEHCKQCAEVCRKCAEMCLMEEAA